MLYSSPRSVVSHIAWFDPMPPSGPRDLPGAVAAR
jgi:hypothetical protein